MYNYANEVKQLLIATPSAWWFLVFRKVSR